MNIVSPAVTGVFAYLVASRKRSSEEKISKAKLDAETQSKALVMVRGIVSDMMDDFSRELNILKSENEALREKVANYVSEVRILNDKISTNNAVIDSLRMEVASLRATTKVYEDELARLRNL